MILFYFKYSKIIYLEFINIKNVLLKSLNNMLSHDKENFYHHRITRPANYVKLNTDIFVSKWEHLAFRKRVFKYLIGHWLRGLFISLGRNSQ